jgi:glycosyltransferase involved in cell wall biosynthesis
MACGTPVIASDTTVFPEVFGNSALLINPLDAKGIATAMQTIIEDKTLAASLRERGLQKAKELTWEKSARKTQFILEKAGDSHL